MRTRTWSIDALALIFSFIVVAQLLTYVVPQGAFDRVPYPDEPDRSIVVPGTYTPAAEPITMPPWQFLLAISDGLADAQDIIFLIFLVGGVIALLRRSGAIDAALQAAVARLGHSPGVLIAGCFVLFSLGSFTIGMGEEYVPLVPIILTLCLAMRMDGLVAMGIVWIPYGIGWGCAGINPFGVLIAQDIANVPLTSGLLARLGLMAVLLAIGFQHVYRYARSVQRDASTSLVPPATGAESFVALESIALSRRHVAILCVLGLGIGGFVYGAANSGWYITELNAVFLAIGLTTALLARFGPAETSRAFLDGAAQMAAPALIVGFARTIGIVLEQGQIIDTVVASVAGALNGLPADVAALGMLVVQTICNLFIPSGSGQAFVTMPIMSPLATLTGLPQQTAVLAYQFGDGFSNMIIPTNALVMGALAIGRVPYTAWVRFVGPLLLKILGVAAIFLIASIHVGAALGLGDV